MTKPVPTHHLTGKPLGNRPDREKTEEILQRLRQAANDRHSHGHAPEMGDDQVQALENVLFPSSQQEKAGSRFPVLIAVFMVSAIAGGAIAGLYLARSSGKPPVLQVAGAKPAEMIVEKDVPQQEAVTTTTIARKDQAQLVAEVRPAGDVAASTATPRPIAPPPLEDGTALERSPVPPEAMAAAPAADFDAASGSTDQGAAVATTPATGGEAAPGQSPDELKALTDNVVQALGSLIPDAGASGEPASTSDLRTALSALVDKAMQEGRSKNEIISLLDKAIEEAGAENIPEELLGPDGKVDLNLLIASVIPKDMALVSSRDRSYVNQLLAEGRATTLKGQNPQARAGRFYTRNGKRYTRIRRGDTLAQIAYDAYGDALAYPRILRANKGRIASVRNLRPGMEIRVPGKNERLTDTTEPSSLVRSAKAGRKAAARKRVTRRAANRRATAKKVARKRQAAPQRKQEPKITDRLLGVIGANGQNQGAAAAQAKPADEPTLTTNFQRYKIGTPPPGN